MRCSNAATARVTLAADSPRRRAAAENPDSWATARKTCISWNLSIHPPMRNPDTSFLPGPKPRYTAIVETWASEPQRNAAGHWDIGPTAGDCAWYHPFL
ncbi:PAS/PAC sensor signal transduction histidine kinase [Pseudomonas sp. St290]|nr:PAS/PAC sensor signal transduction histidine kinase [Pseudomonas sp. St290]